MPSPAAPSSGSDIVRHSVPDRVSRAKCRKLFEEIYANELKDRSPAARRKLAQTLLDEAGKTAEGSPDRFVLLNGAIQAAELPGGNTITQLAPADAGGESHEVNNSDWSRSCIGQSAPA